MSSPIIIPFNFNPVNTGVSNLYYTVPNGKFSRVLVNCIQGTYLINGNSLSMGLGVEFWLKSGDILTTSGFVGSINYSEYFNFN